MSCEAGAGDRSGFLCTENPQLGWGFRKAFSFEPVIKTP
ncbi:invasin, partial [Escherichia coli]